MSKYIAPGLLSLSLLTLIPTTAHADSFTLNFTVTGFGVSAPTDLVTGSFVFDAVSIDSFASDVTAINLTIAGSIYTLGEVEMRNVVPYNYIGGTPLSAFDVQPSTKDFFIRWDVTDPFRTFSYSVPSDGNIYTSSNFTNFSITPTIPTTPSSVTPELPGAMQLIPTMLPIALVAARKRFKKASA